MSEFSDMIFAGTRNFGWEERSPHDLRVGDWTLGQRHSFGVLIDFVMAEIEARPEMTTEEAAKLISIGRYAFKVVAVRPSPEIMWAKLAGKPTLTAFHAVDGGLLVRRSAA